MSYSYSYPFIKQFSSQLRMWKPKPTCRMLTCPIQSEQDRKWRHQSLAVPDFCHSPFFSTRFRVIHKEKSIRRDFYSAPLS
jgi:hypothetical protein